MHTYYRRGQLSKQIPLAVLLFFYIPALLISQSYDWNIFDTRHGLLSSKVQSVYISDDGAVWMAMDAEGITRYEGYDFKHYGKNEGIPAGSIIGFDEDTKGHLWLLTSRHLSWWNQTSNRFDTLAIPAHLANYSWEGFYFDKSGNLWVASPREIWRIDAAYFGLKLPFSLNAAKRVFRAPTISIRPFVMTDDKRGNLFLAFDQFVYQLEQDSFVLFHRIERTHEQEIKASRTVRSLLIKQPDPLTLWIGTKDGDLIQKRPGEPDTTLNKGLRDLKFLVQSKEQIYAGNSDFLYHINKAGQVAYSHNFYESHDIGQAFSFAFDREQGIWIGTGNGLLNAQPTRFSLHYNSDDFLKDGVYSVLSSGHHKRTFFGANYMDLYSENSNGELIREPLPSNKLDNGECQLLMEDSNNRIWMVCPYRGIQCWDGQQLLTWPVTEFPNPFVDITAVYEDTVRQKIVFGFNSGLIVFDTEDLKYEMLFLGEDLPLIGHATSPSFKKFFQGPAGRNWAISNLGLLIQDSQNYLVYHQYTTPLLPTSIEDVVVDKENNLWIASVGDGVYQFRFVTPDSLVFVQHFSTAQYDLISDAPKSITLDTAQNVWLGFLGGINSLKKVDNKDRYEVSSYNYQDGWFNKAYEKIQLRGTPDGRVWAATTKGVASFWPVDFERSKTAPILTIESMEISPFKAIPYTLNYPSKHLATAIAGPARINFRFNGISPAKASKLRYEYQLIGPTDQDTTWQTLGLEHQVTFSLTRQGDYTFKVRCYSAENLIYTSSSNVHFALAVPLKLREDFLIWMVSTGILLLIIISLIFSKNASVKAARAATVREQLMRERDQLRFSLTEADIRDKTPPHFWANIFPNVNRLIEENKIEKARAYLSQAAVYSREFVDMRNWVTIQKEHALLQKYLDLERINFVNLIYELVVDDTENEEIWDIKIPSMLLQPIVENALKHGLSHHQKKQELSIRFSLLPEEEALKIVIQDNGKGLSPSYREGGLQKFGLSAVRKRIEMLAKQIKGHTLTTPILIEENRTDETGAVFTIILPDDLDNWVEKLNDQNL